MKVKDALGLGAADGRTTIPLAVWVPVAVIALVVGVVVGEATDVGGLASILVIALAFGVVMPLSTLVVAVRAGRHKDRAGE